MEHEVKKVPKEELPSCASCARYDIKSSWCAVEKRKKLRSEYCSLYKIRLADHYVPNAWEEWKRKAEKNELRRKYQSG